MRKWMNTAAAVLAAALLASCGKEGFDPIKLERSQAEAISDDVTMHLSENVVREGCPELSLTLMNHTAQEFTYGTQYTLEVYLDGAWYIIPADEDLYFTAIGVVLGADGINSEQIDLADYYSGALPEGRYRIVKEIYGAGADQYTAAEFTIGD